MSAPATAGAPKRPVRLLIALGALVLFGLFWGAGQPLTKVAVSTGHHPMGLVFWQFVFAGTALGIVTAMRGDRLRFDAHHLRFYILIALIGTLLPGVFSYTAVSHLPAGIVAVALATVPMMALMIALGIGNERFALHRVTGIALGVAAMMLIALPEASLPDRSMAPWLVVALVAPFCYAAEGNYMAKDAPPGLHPIPALFAACIAGALISAPLAISTGTWVDLTQPWRAPEYAIAGSGLAHAVAYSGYMWLIAYAGVVFTAQISYIVTGAALAFSIVFLGESYSGWVWGAVAMMAIGLFLVQPARNVD